MEQPSIDSGRPSVIIFNYDMHVDILLFLTLYININQSINRSIDRSIDRSINQSVYYAKSRTHNTYKCLTSKSKPIQIYSSCLQSPLRK